MRILASVLGIPLERTVVEEGAAFGAAMLAGVRAGVYADLHEAIERAVRVRDLVAPDPDWRGIYDEGYARYRGLYPALRPLEDV